MTQKILDIEELTTSFKIGNEYYAAVDDVHLTVNKNEVLAIVGESGSGKSALALSIVGLHQKENTQVTGMINFKGTSILPYNIKVLNRIRGQEIGFVFQEPLTALNPIMRIGDQIEETLKLHTKLSKEKRQERVHRLLKEVGIHDPDRVYKQFPHQLSGGMRQRVVISMAIACEPSLLIADEPTTALDVTVQAQILDLLSELQKKTGMSMILITHDFSVVAQIADRVGVMYAGEIVELGSVEAVLNNPLHPYTRSLLRAVRSMKHSEDTLYAIQGSVKPLHLMERKGCRFSYRLLQQDTVWHQNKPVLTQVNHEHWVRCICYKTFSFTEGDNHGAP